MKLTADTNILIRAITEDDPDQSPIAQRLLGDAELVVLTPTALCEFCWVADRLYGFDRAAIAHAVRTLIAADNVTVDGPTVEAGLSMLDSSGDFADGVIAHAGEWLGGETFVSFDRKAVRLLEAGGNKAMVPA